MYIRFRWQQLGGHVHVRVFIGRDRDHLAKSGDLAFREDERDREWSTFRNKIDGPNVDFIEDQRE